MNTDFLEENQKLIETYFYRVWNNGELDLLDTIMDENYLNHSPGGSVTPPPGPEGLKPIVAAMRKGFPDLHYSIEDLVITKDRIVARVVMTGTLLGELWGMQPNGRRIEVNQINIEYIADGKITAHWRLTDELKMMQQLQNA
ncbi:ester cyclase [Flavihumibacter fluvii]|uniref:ester cyclase n=1 Tax=Flavihumibacter fluvii TaxID=2838157 RepID=UPI001BDEE1D9|nr:ester cyclase [Flavihumibacter fluvii]ULQ54302.1 ester cyclase [Flavihumibacter fluvii]